MNEKNEITRQMRGMADVLERFAYALEQRGTEAFRKQGAERILFGSDCPWDDPANEIALINRMPLSEHERELIFFRNAEKLLGI